MQRDQGQWALGRQSEQGQPDPVQYLKLADEYDVGSTLQDARTEVAICSEERGGSRA